ncbi:MAG: SDR family oxidoreductase [Porticoccaceae bacterium]
MRAPSLPFRHAVITGACGGLGQALARELLGTGASLTLVGLNREVLQRLADQAPDRVGIHIADVSDSAAMQPIATECIGRAGLPDLVVANAGVAGGMDTAEAADLAVMRRMLEINLLGPATTFQPFLKAARQTPGARCALVGVASIAGWRGMPGNGAYCASKGGLIRYLESLRAECRGSAVTVHTVSPGYLRTPLTAGNRFAMPGLMDADVAARALLQGVARGLEHIVLPRRIGWLSRLLACLPVRVHDRILLNQPRKPRPGEPGSTPIPGLSGAAAAPPPAAD